MSKKTAVAAKKTAAKAKKKTLGAPTARSRAVTNSRVRATAPPAAAALFYRLHALLGTVRSIAGYEDHLCTLLHEVQTQAAASPELTRDLHALLDEIPAPATYMEEIEATRRTLSNCAPVKKAPSKRLPERKQGSARVKRK